MGQLQTAVDTILRHSTELAQDVLVRNRHFDDEAQLVQQMHDHHAVPV